MFIQLTREPIDTHELLARVSDRRAGAVVLFLGTVREFTAGRQTAALDYECYPEMAEQELHRLAEEATRRWQLVGLAIVHRLGRLDLGEASVAVAVSAAHRRAAFEAGQWLIDTLKVRVPIWKRENWADGTTQWVHPGLEEPADPPPAREATP